VTTVPKQLQSNVFFALSSPIASLIPLNMTPQMQDIGATTFKIAD
jgi:hypothetical protein